MRWDLDDLYIGFDAPAYKQDFAELSVFVADVTAWAETELSSQSNAAAKMEEYIKRQGTLARLLLMLHYASLVMSVDTKNAAAAKQYDLLCTKLAELTKPEVQFRKFVKELPGLDATIESSALLREHVFVLREMKAQSVFQLADDVEAALAKMSITGSDAWENLRDSLTSLLMIDVEVKGKTHTEPLAIIRNMAYDADAEIRKNAYVAELAAYPRVDTAVAAALNSVKGEALTQVKLRGYDSPLHMTLVSSRMERQTLDAMMDAICVYLPSLRRFYKKKAEILGHAKGLPFYDLFAPVGEIDMRFSYDDAIAFIVKQFTSFSKNLGDYARRAFDNHWIDAEPREGKRGGAFCDNLHAIGQSRIMANFSGSFSDVSTLAHELGHGFHGECLKNVSPMNSDYSMPIAETASTFCETIIANAAMQNATDAEKIVLLENEITDMTQVVVDIYSRYVFETNFFAAREEGPLSVEEINALMLDAQKKAYGDGLDAEVLHPYMWLCKPHYYSAGLNYYNFPYAYGMLFSKGLYAEFQRTGEAFAAKYEKLLEATGCHTLEAIGDLAGINVRDKAFWMESLKQVEIKIDEFCALS